MSYTIDKRRYIDGTKPMQITHTCVMYLQIKPLMQKFQCEILKSPMLEVLSFPFFFFFPHMQSFFFFFFFQLLQSCPTLHDATDCTPPGSSVHVILQVRMLEYVAISSSRGSSQPRDQTHVSYDSCIGRWVPLPLTHPGSPLLSVE